jgi:hypothetical protein
MGGLMGFRDIKEIAQKIGDMESGIIDQKTGDIVPMPFIVLRHADFSNTDGHHLHGLCGVKTIKVNGVGGSVESRTFVDENLPCTFYHDRNNVQFAVIPDCKRNREVLLVPNNVRQLLTKQPGARAALLTIMEGPKDLIEAIDKIKADISTKKIDPKPKNTNIVNNPKDPFNYMVSDVKMAVDGEA